MRSRTATIDTYDSAGITSCFQFSDLQFDKHENQRNLQRHRHRRRHGRISRSGRHGSIGWARRPGRAELNGRRLPELRLRAE